MSLPWESQERVKRLPPRPPTPGPIYNNVGELLYRNSGHEYDTDSQSRLSSIDLVTSPTGQSVWIEMEHARYARRWTKYYKRLTTPPELPAMSTETPSNCFEKLDLDHPQ